MRGDGTENNPFIPETLTEFIQAVGPTSGSGVYVELEHDILANEDPEYSGELNSEIYFNVKKLDGKGYSVKGVTFRSPSMIQLAGNPGVIQNISFLNFYHKRTTTGDYSIYSTASASLGFLHFENCNFSVRSIPISGTVKFAKGITFNKCGINLKSKNDTYPGNASTNGILDDVILNQSTIIIDTVAQTVFTGSANSAVFNNCTTYQCAIFIKNMRLYSSTIYTNGLFTGNNSYGYAVIEIIETTRDNNYTIGSNTSFYVYLINKTSNNITINPSITLEQLKDKDYLIDIGWLP